MRTRRVADTILPPHAAAAAGLRYTQDAAGNGIHRVRCGSGFRYVGPDGAAVRDKATLARIKALAIPPAWRDVWIARDPNAHLQATGRDARGRKQYRYHARWREIRHQTKYERLVPFGRALPRLRERVRRDLSSPALSKQKVIAAVVQLLERTWIRVGNSEYARANGSFGLTTLRDRHARVRGKEICFVFVGKSGIKQSVTLEDSLLARVVKKCQDLPGQELFQYVDDHGRRRPITSADVNAYIRRAVGDVFTAKDFRTWAGTVLALQALKTEKRQESTRHQKSVIVRAITAVAGSLGNTPAVCRSSYIHPAILQAYADGSLHRRMRTRGMRVRGLTAEEVAVLHLLKSRRSFRQQLAEAARVARASRRRAMRRSSPARRAKVARA